MGCRNNGMALKQLYPDSILRPKYPTYKHIKMLYVLFLLYKNYNCGFMEVCAEAFYVGLPVTRNSSSVTPIGLLSS